MSELTSRHINNKKYHTYITYAPNTNHPDAIKDWICTCKTGKRTVGCCSHTASLIYYLSNVRHTTTKKATKHLDTIFPDPIVADSSDESDDSDATIVDSDDTEIYEYQDDTQQTQPIQPTLYPDI
jgi:hypothetical protein